MQFSDIIEWENIQHLEEVYYSVNQYFPEYVRKSYTDKRSIQSTRQTSGF